MTKDDDRGYGVHNSHKGIQEKRAANKSGYSKVKDAYSSTSTFTKGAAGATGLTGLILSLGYATGTDFADAADWYGDITEYFNDVAHEASNMAADPHAAEAAQYASEIVQNLL